MIRVILWDIDGTLLDFKASERAAMSAAFRRFGLGTCTGERMARYSVLNDRWWKALERGEITREQLLPGRFRAFFRAEGLACDDCEAFNEYYQRRLGDTVVFRDGADRLVRSLVGRVKQYAVTNGTLTAQIRKLRSSGLADWLDGAFISEQVGAEKPSPRYFEQVLAAVPQVPRDEILIVGDSLTSDMKGGSREGLVCCWYDPEGRPLPPDLDIRYHIRDLGGIPAILAAEAGGQGGGG